MNDAEARRNHWVNHIARHAHANAYILTDSGASLLVVEEATAGAAASARAACGPGIGFVSTGHADGADPPGVPRARCSPTRTRSASR